MDSEKSRWIIAVDPGMLSHYTGIVVLEGVPADFGPRRKFRHHVRHLERQRRTSYAAVADRLVELKDRPELHNATLLVDAGGVGVPFLETLQERRTLRPVGITLTGGESDAHQDPDTRLWRVPKTRLLGSLQLVVDQGRLHISDRLKLAHVLVEELIGLELVVTDSGNLVFRHGGTEGHSDLAMAAAYAIWWLEKRVTMTAGEYISVQTRRGFGRHEPVWGQYRTGNRRW
jgi:hypothetical protein